MNYLKINQYAAFYFSIDRVSKYGKYLCQEAFLYKSDEAARKDLERILKQQTQNAKTKGLPQWQEWGT